MSSKRDGSSCKNRLNWRVLIECIECGAEFRCNSVTASSQVLDRSMVPVDE